MASKTGIYVGMTPEQQRIHRVRRNAMGKGVTWAQYLDRLAELADERVINQAVSP